jgi:hypothetical protein
MLQGVKPATCAFGEAPPVWASSPAPNTVATTTPEITLRKVSEQ